MKGDRSNAMILPPLHETHVDAGQQKLECSPANWYPSRPLQSPRRTGLRPLLPSPELFAGRPSATGDEVVQIGPPQRPPEQHPDDEHQHDRKRNQQTGFPSQFSALRARCAWRCRRIALRTTSRNSPPCRCRPSTGSPARHGERHRGEIVGERNHRFCRMMQGPAHRSILRPRLASARCSAGRCRAWLRAKVSTAAIATRNIGPGRGTGASFCRRRSSPRPPCRRAA